jgi:acyl-CoA thioester hydrolase
MSRLLLSLPEKFNFSTRIPIRITDINYGGHLGNDTVLTLIHEARVQYLLHHELGELDFCGVGLIMSDVGIEFRTEAFYGDTLVVNVAAGDFSRASFAIYYELRQLKNDVVVARAKTGMICYNYQLKKVVSIPEEAKARLGA